MVVESLCVAACSLVVYHHAIYPLALRALVRRAGKNQPCFEQGAEMSKMTLIVPAFNEASTIREKVANSAALEAGDGKLRIVIACDGCTDGTAAIAREAIAQQRVGPDRFEVVEYNENRGKVPVLNEIIAHTRTPLIALSDTSAMLDANAAQIAASHFADPRVGFVTGCYSANSRSAAVETYWAYQRKIKKAEAALGAPIGAHGAFYAFRRSEWEPLEADTINDDVILPMRIIQRGFTGVYDESIRVREAEQDTVSTDLRRRRRLAAGALQQTIRLAALADPRRPGIAFAFLSGKALRAFMPLIMALALVTNVLLATGSAFWTTLLMLQLAVYGFAIVGMTSERARRNKVIGAISYLVSGHLNGLIGAVGYLAGRYQTPWTREKFMEQDHFMPPAVTTGKRALDILVASVAFVGFVVLFVPIALAIKLESKGPIFYRQLRVGLRTSSQSRLFYLTKFRTMRVDAEASSGAVWASKNDSRITRVGNFLRKTRLDELPQCIDVLRGDMSIVGPRPERPQFFENLESNIPFYAERTYGLKPGITGLAQVNLPYDSSIEDVRAKVLYDHAYAMQLTAPGKWLAADLSIIVRTFTVMVLGKGQ